jgi:hypothetical protein
MSHREAVRDHFAAMIDAYRGSIAARTLISARSGDRIVGASSGAVASGAEKPYVHVVRSHCSKGRGRK